MASCELANRCCAPCRSDIPPLKGEPLDYLRRQLGEEWNVVGEHHLEKPYVFKDFRQALAFTNAVGAIAEQEGHHPEITLSWGKATVRLWTHKIDGLSESDFILAAKADQAYTERNQPC